MVRGADGDAVELANSGVCEVADQDAPFFQFLIQLPTVDLGASRKQKVGLAGQDFETQRRQLFCRPGPGLLNLGAFLLIVGPLSYTHLTLPTIIRV